MGHGSVLAEFAIEAEILKEAVEVAIVRAPEQNGHFALLFYASGGTPVSAQIALPALLLQTPNAASIHIDVPPVPTFPGAPNVAVAELNAALGPRGLTYHEHIHGKTTSYHPTGVLLPDHCPRGGFPFTASLTFEDGSHASASTTVPCPTRGRQPAWAQSTSPNRRAYAVSSAREENPNFSIARAR